MKYFDIERFKDFDRVYTFVLCKRKRCDMISTKRRILL